MRILLALLYLFLIATPVVSQTSTQIICLEVSGVNAKTTGVTAIGTTSDNSLRFHPLFLLISVEAQSGTITAAASVRIGTNSPPDDIFGIFLTQLTTSTDQFKNDLTNLKTMLAPSTTVNLDITTAATGTGTQSITFRLFGFYA